MAKRSPWRPKLMVGVLAALGMLLAVACGAAEEATPTPTSGAATPTPTIPAATPTSTSAVPPTATATLRPGVTPVVATPTPTRLPEVKPTATPSGLTPKRGGVIRQVSQRDPSGFDTQTATSGRDVDSNAKFYANLFINNTGGVMEPNVVESYTLENGGKTWVFKIHNNVGFAKDGYILKTSDVKYSLRKMMGLVDGVISERTGWLKEYVDFKAPGEGIEIVDATTFKLHLTRPAAVIPELLGSSHAGMLREGTTREQLKLAPDGAGPWKIKQWVSGALIAMERNPYYFKAGKPYPDEWHMVHVFDGAVASSAFITGKVDIRRDSVMPEDHRPIYERMLKEGKIEWPKAARDCRPQAVNMNSSKPPFNSLKLRQAVNLAVDREAYMTVQWANHGIPALVFALDTEWGRPSSEVWNVLPGWGTGAKKQQEIEEAKRLVAQEYPNGLKLDMMVRNSTGYPEQAEFIAAELERVGISGTLKLMDSTVVFTKAAAGEWMLWPYWFCQTLQDPDEMWNGYFITGGSRNWLQYSSPELDALALQMSVEMDRAKRKQLNRQLEDIVLRDLPIAPLPDSETYHTYYTYIKGWDEGISGYTMNSQDDAWVEPH